MKTRIKRSGQALVETALLITLLFFLVSAAFDLGMLFFAYQGAANAALEGVSYGSLYPFDENNIQLRVRNEPGITTNQVRFVNLRDLDSQNGTDSEAIVDQYITITAKENKHGEQMNADPDINTDCANRRTIEICDLYVKVRFTYRPLFFLAPLMGAGELDVAATRSMTIRDESSP